MAAPTGGTLLIVSWLVLALAAAVAAAQIRDALRGKGTERFAPRPPIG